MCDDRIWRGSRLSCYDPFQSAVQDADRSARNPPLDVLRVAVDPPHDDQILEPSGDEQFLVAEEPQVPRAEEASPLGLVRQPGETLAERAGPSQRIRAVTRHQNFDTLENQVLRSYAELARSVARASGVSGSARSSASSARASRDSSAASSSRFSTAPRACPPPACR